ncbi:MAG TPA: FIST N-terminal domain-containing protein [Tepidisphaeraceae bacterium]|nr:FIST N-terminal domain-containing protein [Tepidisphaeraceae bacterium]
MRFHAALSEHESSLVAVDELIESVRASGVEADVAFVFVSRDHVDQADEIAERLWLRLDPQALVGVSAEGVIGPAREVERAPGMAVLVGRMPGVRIHPFHVPPEEFADVLADHALLAERLGGGPETRAVVALGDPFSTPTNRLLPAIDEALPGVPVVGGMASAGQGPGQNVLFRNDRIYTQGLVGLSLSGPGLEVQTVVSQGCRPFGKTYVVTKAHDNVIEQLGGRPALAALRDAVMDLSEADRQLLARGLFVGRAISEYRESFGRGDFLVRTVMNVDNETGVVEVGDYVRVGQTVQFQVRDAATATEDLSLMLATVAEQPAAPAGGLLFSCNGRGTRLFDAPCHDVDAARAALPATPVAGFFAAGELGPVGRRNFIHGHTASFALFRGK